MRQKFLRKILRVPTLARVPDADHDRVRNTTLTQQARQRFIDGRYRTRPGPGSTFIMGSSMGGMISIYAMNEYPQVFGGAAGMSTHWVGGFTPIAGRTLPAFIYLRDHLAAPEGHRLYMDRGTIEIDAWYGVAQAFIDDLVRERGYTSANLVSRVFEGKGHNERDWAARLEIPLLFLLGKAQTGASK